MKDRCCARSLATLTRILAVSAGTALPGALWAQSCALCYQAAASSGARFIEALRSGIIILIMAPVAICIGFAIAAYRKRNLCADDDYSEVGGTMEIASEQISCTEQATCKSE
jgi:hypothetical protein